MRYVDVAIIGGGLAGSTAAAMLGRAGISAALVDPHIAYPADFRCEKIGGSQMALLRKTGLAETTLAATTLDSEVWEVRFGCLVDRKPSDQHGIRYEALVNSMRAQIPANVTRHTTKATGIATSDDRQKVTLADGSELSARLVVLANGLNVGLRHLLGIERTVISPSHSITIGFDLVPVGRPAFDFPALTWWTFRASDRLGYLTLFPIGDTMRANLMVYRDVDDPWLRQMRTAPEATLNALMPGLARFTGDYAIDGPVRVRPADLYVSGGHRQSGLVLVGDAFGTSCPAAGTGTDKVFTDVTQLCNIHIPQWLATDGMDVDKISAFYDDPVKTACDAWSLDKAYHLKSLSVDPGMGWMTRRLGRFGIRLAQGTLRKLRTGGKADPVLQETNDTTAAQHGRAA